MSNIQEMFEELNPIFEAYNLNPDKVKDFNLAIVINTRIKIKIGILLINANIV